MQAPVSHYSPTATEGKKVPHLRQTCGVKNVPVNSPKPYRVLKAATCSAPATLTAISG
jgi:hypothetical protein